MVDESSKAGSALLDAARDERANKTASGLRRVWDFVTCINPELNDEVALEVVKGAARRSKQALEQKEAALIKLEFKVTAAARSGNRRLANQLAQGLNSLRADVEVTRKRCKATGRMNTEIETMDGLIEVRDAAQAYDTLMTSAGAKTTRDALADQVERHDMHHEDLFNVVDTVGELSTSPFGDGVYNVTSGGDPEMEDLVSELLARDESERIPVVPGGYGYDDNRVQLQPRRGESMQHVAQQIEYPSSTRPSRVDDGQGRYQASTADRL